MPRVDIPVIGPAYESREKPLSAQVTRNLWPEVNPEARNPVALHHTPGLKPFASLSGADRGMHEFGNRMYAVNGSSLYLIDDEGEDTNLGTITGSGSVSMASDVTQLMIATSGWITFINNQFVFSVDGPLYRYTTTDGLELVTDDGINFNPTSGQFQVSLPGKAKFEVDPLDFATAEGDPDATLVGVTWHQNVYFFGRDTVEPWFNSGVGTPPFQRVKGGVRPYGIAGKDAISLSPDYMYILDDKRVPRRTADGMTYTNIGTPPLGVEFLTYSSISDCRIWSFIQDNQTFVVYTFPTANRTWCFHQESNSWFQWADGVNEDRHRGSSALHIYGLNYVADHSNGNIYELDPCTYTDNDKTIRRVRDTGTVHGGMFGAPGAKLFFDEVEFIFAQGDCDSKGLGAIPVTPPGITGVCASTSDLTIGNLLPPTPMAKSVGLLEASPHLCTPPITTADTKVFSFTAAFVRTAAPGAGKYAPLLSITKGFAPNRLIIHLDENGYIKIEGRNSANTIILDATITNNGGSFIDSTAYVLAMVIDLSDTTKREIYINGTNVAENASWTTWTTYTDDTLHLKSEAGNVMKYGFGQGISGVSSIPFGYETVGWNGDYTGYDGNRWYYGDKLAFVSFDNTCSLVSGAVCTSDGYVTDPQEWSGWYTSQPFYFMTTTWTKNSGRSAPEDWADLSRATNANTTEEAWQGPKDDVGLELHSSRILNSDLTDDLSFTTFGGGLPSAPTTPRVEIDSPHWNNLGGSKNWISLSNYSQENFDATFGQQIEARDSFEGVYTVNKAIRVQTSDADQRLTFVPDSSYQSAAIVLVDEDGDLVDWCYTVNSGSFIVGTNVTVSSDAAVYYLVITSDTGSAKIKMWDSSP